MILFVMGFALMVWGAFGGPSPYFKVFAVLVGAVLVLIAAVRRNYFARRYRGEPRRAGQLSAMAFWISTPKGTACPGCS